MPLFVCESCGCVESTALVTYDAAAPRCSACTTGRWHEKFGRIGWKAYLALFPAATAGLLHKPEKIDARNT